MENILLLSSIIPSPENKRSTPIVTYFANEWVKMGYNVIIIHNKATYPIFYYWVAKLFKKYIINLTGGAIVDTNRINKSVEYKIENVTIYQIPVYKKMPHGKYSSKTIILVKAVQIFSYYLIIVTAPVIGSYEVS